MRVPLLVLALAAALAACSKNSDPAPTGAGAAVGLPDPPSAPQDGGRAPEQTTVSVLRADDPQQPPFVEVRAWSRQGGQPLPDLGYDIYWQTEEGPSKTGSAVGAEGWARNAFPAFAQVHNLYLRPTPLTAPVVVALGQFLEPGMVVRVDLVVPAAAVIMGVVLDELGQPVPGALLAGFHDAQPAIDMQERPEARSTGNADEFGAFQLGGFPPGPFVLEAGLDARGTIWRLTGVLTEGQVVQGVEIQLEPCHNVFGQVLDASGSPVKNASIVAGKLGRRQQSRPGPADGLRYVPGRPLLARSDERGTFNLPSVPDNQTWSVVVEHPRYKKQIERIEPGQVDVLIRLEEGLRISGSLLLPDGQPAARVILTLAGGPADTTDAATKQGRFDFGGLDPAANLWIVVMGEGFAPLLHGPLELSAQSIEGLSLQLQAGQILAGKVQAADGSVVEGARVSLQRLDLPAGLPEGILPAALGQASSVTGSGGDFSFAGLAAGQYRISARAPDGRAQQLDAAAGAPGLVLTLP